MEYKIIDSHAHYDDDAFDLDRDDIIGQLNENGIGKVINIGASIRTSKNSIKLMEKYPFFYAAIGVHPNDVEELNEENMKWLEKNSKREKVVAIGEIGLDYYYDEPSKEIQKKWFKEQLLLAKKVNLPVVIHSREAAYDTITILKEFREEKINGVIHCYSYTKESAREFLEMGYSFGIGGVVTFKNGKKLREAVEYIPMDKLLLETDCPYLAPEPFRGKRNSSLYIPYMVKQISEIKKISEEEVIRITSENSERMFNLK